MKKTIPAKTIYTCDHCGVESSSPLYCGSRLSLEQETARAYTGDTGPGTKLYYDLCEQCTYQAEQMLRGFSKEAK